MAMAEKDKYERENLILQFGGKTRFCDLTRKHDFVVLVEKYDFVDFDGKTRFCGFGRKF